MHRKYVFKEAKFVFGSLRLLEMVLLLYHKNIAHYFPLEINSISPGCVAHIQNKMAATKVKI